jgi:hypothetical protein
MSRDRLEKKFERLTYDLLDASRTLQIAKMIAGMESTEYIGQFTPSLATA